MKGDLKHYVQSLIHSEVIKQNNRLASPQLLNISIIYSLLLIQQRIDWWIFRPTNKLAMLTPHTSYDKNKQMDS